LGCVFRLSSEEALIFFFYTAAAAQTNTPQLAAASMAPFQSRDWFSAAQLSLSLAIRIVSKEGRM